MRRWHEDFPRTLREWKKHRRDHVNDNVNLVRVVGRDPDEVDCGCDEQPGRFRKRHAFDCGHTRCWLCHGDKYPKRTNTMQELRADLKLREGREPGAAADATVPALPGVS